MWSFDKDENGVPRVKLAKFFASLCWDSPEKKRRVFRVLPPTEI